MSITEAVAATMLLMDFLVGIGLGTFLTVCLAFVREDRQYSLKGRPPGAAAAGARVLVGVATRSARPGRAPYRPSRQLQGRGVNK